MPQMHAHGVINSMTIDYSLMLSFDLNRLMGTITVCHIKDIAKNDGQACVTPGIVIQKGINTSQFSL